MHAPKQLDRMVKPSLLLQAVNMIMLELTQLYFIMSAITAGQLVIIKCLSVKQESNQIFFSGPDLPNVCVEGTMVQSPYGHGVNLLGCFSDPYNSPDDSIYEMYVDSNREFAWKKLSQSLKYPTGFNPIVSYIDDEFTNCSLSLK